MLKLIYSDYDTDQVTRIKGSILPLETILEYYFQPDRTKFTIVGLYADNKKYSVVATNSRYIHAIKPYSTHKDNNRYWYVTIDKYTKRFSEFVIRSDMVKSNPAKFQDYLSNLTDQNYESLIDLPFSIDKVNDKFNNGNLFITDITEIDRVWFEQKRGENLLK